MELRGDRGRPGGPRAEGTGDAGEGFAGANVTVPHKQAALALADAPSEVAREIGAANTLVFAEGAIGAHNTDADGFLAALPAPPAGQRALVLGAGGAARAVVWALEREGAEVEVWNRTAGAGRGALRRAGRDAGRRSRPGRLRADRQHQRRRPRWRGSVRRPAAGSRRVRRRADRRRHGLRRRAEPAPCRRRRRPARRPSTGSRSSSSRAPSRCASGPVARRRSRSMRAAAYSLDDR